MCSHTWASQKVSDLRKSINQIYSFAFFHFNNAFFKRWLFCKLLRIRLFFWILWQCATIGTTDVYSIEFCQWIYCNIAPVPLSATHLRFENFIQCFQLNGTEKFSAFFCSEFRLKMCRNQINHTSMSFSILCELLLFPLWTRFWNQFKILKMSINSI